MIDNSNVMILVTIPDCFSGERKLYMFLATFVLPIFQHILTVSKVDVIIGSVTNVPMNSYAFYTKCHK